MIKINFLNSKIKTKLNIFEVNWFFTKSIWLAINILIGSFIAAGLIFFTVVFLAVLADHNLTQAGLVRFARRDYFISAALLGIGYAIKQLRNSKTKEESG